MSPPSSISHADLDTELTMLHFGVTASDLHGALCGFLCGGAHADAHNWLGALAIEPVESIAGKAHPMIDRLYAECRDQLDDVELSFEPLLPDVDETLAARAEALVEWCRGFLGGIGLAGADSSSSLSDDGSEILKDFAAIAATHFEFKDAEEDETALYEVIEFIRVGVLLLHTELCAPPGAGATMH